MSTYFEVKNDNGFIQINDNTAVFRLSEVSSIASKYAYSGAFTFTDYKLGRYAHTGYFYHIAPEDNMSDVYFLYNPSDTPVMVNTSYYCPYYTTVKPYQSHYYQSKRGWWVCVHSCTKEQADALKIVKFTNTIPTNSSFGMECFDSLGNKVFSSNITPLKIVNYSNYIHTTDSYVFWTSNWTMQTPKLSYSFPIGIWASQVGCGGTGGQAAGYSKTAQFYLSRSSVEMCWMHNWENEHSNVKDVWWYWSAMYGRPSAVTNFVISDLSLCV